MFKKFTKEDVSSISKCKSSVQRAIRSQLSENYPDFSNNLDELLPKKEGFQIGKCPGHIQFIVVDNTPLFFQHRNGHWLPTLRLLYEYPDMMKKIQVDRGAVKHIMGGADVMCPGITSRGGKIFEELPADTPVAVMVEGKTLPVGIGVLSMSTQQIKSEDTGVGVKMMHHLGDALWDVPDFIM
eukprot:gb/GECH01010554.1/.p1 GENE.gb/GECH01010554.1/~~gb/GECH01010554.1/.p1  ORF type:complete len:183 (+),score=36.69 gb/GECH01010554.1/:1-549(+)